MLLYLVLFLLLLVMASGLMMLLDGRRAFRTVTEVIEARGALGELLANGKMTGCQQFFRRTIWKMRGRGGARGEC